MSKLFDLGYRVLFALAIVGALFAVAEGVAGFAGHSLVDHAYSAGRLLDFSAILMIFAVGLRLHLTPR